MCKSTGIFATLASPIDTMAIRQMEKTPILEENGFDHVYEEGYNYAYFNEFRKIQKRVFEANHKNSITRE